MNKDNKIECMACKGKGYIEREEFKTANNVYDFRRRNGLTVDVQPPEAQISGRPAEAAFAGGTIFERINGTPTLNFAPENVEMAEARRKYALWCAAQCVLHLGLRHTEVVPMAREIDRFLRGD